MKVEIRQATKADCVAILPLVWIIIEDMELPLLAEIPAHTVQEWLLTAMKTEDYRYSYRRMQVAVIEDNIAGVVVSYDGQDEEGIDKVFNEIAKKAGYDVQLFTDAESDGQEWYLDTLVVDAKYRGYGVATQLIAAVVKRAKVHQAECIGLNVDVDNFGARKLYDKLGFTKVGTRQLAMHQYDHLQMKVK